jgi:asparagine synthase (glutamine-hydrolysing)
MAHAGHCELLFSGALAPDARSSANISDGDTVVNAYLRDGPSVFPRLRGRFAIVLVDRRSGVSFALRDPLGAHPLFYAVDDRTLYLSPSAAAVACRDGKAPELNRLAAAAFILRTSLDAEETLFEGVRRLLQCHLLERHNGRIQTRRYWEPEAERDVEDVLAELHRLLVQAIERNVDGRAGVFLSGGLDSALVAAVLADVARSRGHPPPVALSIAFRGTDADEEATQRLVASRLGLEQVIRTPSELLRHEQLLEAALALGHSFTAQPPELLTPTYDALAALGSSHGCTTILGGSGGDEWLEPQPGYAADRVRSLDVLALLELARAWHGYWPGLSRLGAMRSAVWRSGARPLGRQVVLSVADRVTLGRIDGIRSRRAERRIPAWLAPDETLRRSLVAGILSRTAPRSLAADAEKRTLLESENMSVAQELAFVDGRRTGVGFRSPLLDPDLVAFLYGLPPRRLVAGGRCKALARDALAPYVGDLADSWPQTVYGDSLWAEAIRAEGGRVWSLSGGAPLLTALGAVDPVRLEASLIRPARQASAPELASAWRAVSLDSWFRRLCDRRIGL